VAAYEAFARFYDAVNEEPVERIAQVLDFIERFNPNATSVLELGCGTGAILSGLGSGFERVGVDLSPEMLAFARRRCPTARFVEGDITTVDLGRTFDVVVCVFDTLNHVTTFAGWREVFACVARHLSSGGLFVVDLNTIGRFRELDDSAPWVHDFDGHTLLMDLDFSADPLATWDIRIFEAQGDGRFTLHHESIVELAVALDEVYVALREQFTLLECSDALGGPASDEAARALIVARRS